MKQSYPIFGAYKLLTALLLAAPLSACDNLFGQEVARLPINVISKPGQEVVKETTLQLQQGEELAIWSDMDMAYDGEAPVRFQVQILQNGAPYQQLELDPTEKNVTVGEVKTSVNDKTSWSFTGKSGTLTAPTSGTYTFKARLVAAPNPSLVIKKAELVLKK
ncbi:hypothetical protein HNQ93_002322 [Hymenobacter luteus]|uniref:DUF4625 domain-containing protein n=2 Tax=Hymenobacter TaxID=89966 RepID=A0A7W9T0Q9_9BACT|nr:MULTISPECIES: hypothetical protein [Hymenobacter]MBB4602109.1 hypothetical protein [Hymenobacter latericoloratus]MBB6059462.1 hypothetical protein [Hymenobacter luteus]